MIRTLRLIVVLWVAMAPWTHAWAQVQDQRELAQRIAVTRPSERAGLLEQVAAIPPGDVSEDLKMVLITALELEGQRIKDREASIRQGRLPAPSDDPELMLGLIRVVVPFKDPRAIPALAGVLGTGMRSVRALVAFGDAAVTSTVAVVASPESMTAAVDDGLVALRMMVELQTPQRRLLPTSLAEIRRAAELRLRTPGRASSNGVTVRWAIDLAAALNEPALRAVVQALASDPGESISRGIVDPRLIEKTQKQAADRLAGIPALPRP